MKPVHFDSIYVIKYVTIFFMYMKYDKVLFGRDVNDLDISRPSINTGRLNYSSWPTGFFLLYILYKSSVVTFPGYLNIR